MNEFFQNILSTIKKNVSSNQDGLDIYRVRVKHDPANSRVILTQTSEIGIDFKVDAIEMGIGIAAKQLGVDGSSD